MLTPAHTGDYRHVATHTGCNHYTVAKNLLDIWLSTLSQNSYLADVRSRLLLFGRWLAGDEGANQPLVLPYRITISMDSFSRLVGSGSRIGNFYPRRPSQSPRFGLPYQFP